MVASTLPERTEFISEGVNNESYSVRHNRLIFEDGFSFSGFERDKFWLNTPDGKWFDVSNISGADDENDGRALCLADFDDDGDIDFFVHNIQRERHRLYRNEVGSVSGNGWIKVRLTATGGHASAAGAVITVRFPGRIQAKVLSLGSGFLSQNASELVFGLGTAESAQVEVQWPGREMEIFGTAPSGSRLHLVEGAGTPEAYAAHTFDFADPVLPGLRIHLGDKIPTLPLADAKGTPVEFDAELPDRPVLINFWATYCVACVAELPDLQRLHEKGEWHVVLIGMDHLEDRERAEALLAEKGVTLDHFYYSDELVEKILDPVRMPLPTTFFMGEGKLREVLQAPIHDWSGWQWEE